MCPVVAILLTTILPAFLQIMISENVEYWIKAPPSSQDFYAHALLLLSVGFIVSSILRNCVINFCVLGASRNLHQAMARSLLATASLFFDQNPLGKILTRFSKDIATADTVLPVILTYFMEAWARVLSVLVVVCIIEPWLLLAVIFLFLLAHIIRHRLLSVQCQVMSLELQSRAPIITHLSACLADLPSL